MGASPKLEEVSLSAGVLQSHKEKPKIKKKRNSVNKVEK
jgi:hypothetical protein